MVHQYQLNGYNIVLDSCSGSIHVVDEVAYDIIALFETHTPEEIVAAMLEKYGGRPDVTEEDVRGCIQDVQALKDAGKLFSPDTFADMAGTFKERSGNVVKALCLHVAHTCNLNCEYCFASQGKYHGDRALMSFEVGKQALDFLMDHSGTRRNLEVDFFGGEPLMNWDVVKDLVRYARSIEEEKGKHFRFTLTTNGVLLDDEVMDFANREMHNVVLSLDGRKEVHDHLRKNYAGQGSYDVIVPKFQEFVRRRGNKDYYVRGTFTRENLDFADDVEHLASLGFRHVSVEPASGPLDDPFAIKEGDLPAVEAEYEKLARQLQGRKDVNFFHFNVDLAQGPCVIKRLRGCGAGCEYVAITPDGDIYPCHQFVGREEYRMGNVRSGDFDMDISGKFAELNIYTREDCRNCWARFYCSGGCSASNLLVNGDIKKPNAVACEMERKRLECAIALRAIAAGMGETENTECNNTDCSLCGSCAE